MVLMEGNLGAGRWAPPLTEHPPFGTRLGLGGRGGSGEGEGPWNADMCPFPPAELKATGTAHFFNFLLNSSDYRILLKDEDHDRMYVGSKDYVLSLDLHDINREPLIVSCHHRAWVEAGQTGTQGCILDAGPRARWASLVLVGQNWGQAGNPGLVSPQIHWPASQQRIEECILSGKNSNVSGHHKPPSGSSGWVGDQHWGGTHVLVSYPGEATPGSPVAACAAMPGWGGTLRCLCVLPPPLSQTCRSWRALWASRRPRSPCCFLPLASAEPFNVPAHGPCQPLP